MVTVSPSVLVGDMDNTSITWVNQSTTQRRKRTVEHKSGIRPGLALRRGLLGHILEHRDDIKAIARKYGVERVWVIGSVAEGTDTTMSDLDLFVCQ